jgi:hypothetical protein
MPRINDQVFIDHFRQVDPMLHQAEPLVVAVRETVQHVNHRVSAILFGLVTGRQVDGNIAIRRIATEVALERFAVDFDPFHRALLGLPARVG